MPTVSPYTISREYYKVLENENLFDLKEEMDEILAQYRNVRGGLIPVLQQAQEKFGYLSPTVLDYISVKLNIPSSDIFGVVSFYSFFTMVPRGKFIIKVCLGTACYVQGSSKIIFNIENGLNIKVGQTTEDRMFTLQEVRCLGACGLAPVIMVNEDTYGMVKPDKVMDLLNKYAKGSD
jgi:NADH:ubiquinone oxidoreductase subunit E